MSADIDQLANAVFNALDDSRVAGEAFAKVRTIIAAAREEGRAAGYGEAKEQAIEAVRKKGLSKAQFDDGMHDAQMCLEIIDTLLPLAPAATKEGPK